MCRWIAKPNYVGGGRDKKNDIKNPNAAVAHTLPSFDDAKQVLSLLPDAPNHEEQFDRASGLSLKKCLSFGCFDSHYVLFWG